jgi:Asp/Glu/hydantoin racemase
MTGSNMAAIIDAEAMATELTRIRTGRSSIMTPEVKALVIDMLSQGHTVESVGRTKGMPCKGTIVAAGQVDAAFLSALSHARKVGAVMLAEDTINLIDNVELVETKDQKFQSNELRKADIQARVRMRLAESYNPEQFGQQKNQVNVQVNIKTGGASQWFNPPIED